MSDETAIDIDPADAVVKLVTFFHEHLEEYRPGARYVLTCTNEAIMLAFCDHGGELRNDTVRLSSGPLRPHPINPGWQPPTFSRVRIRVQGGTGDVEALVPPVLWLPGPGEHQRAVGAPQPTLPRPDIIDI